MAKALLGNKTGRTERAEGLAGRSFGKEPSFWEKPVPF